MVLDAVKPHTHRDILTRELESVGIRLNREPPQIYLKKKKTGGLSFNSTVPLTKLDEKLVQRVLQEYKVHNADVLIKEDASVDDLIDVLEVRGHVAVSLNTRFRNSDSRVPLLHFSICYHKLGTKESLLSVTIRYDSGTSGKESSGTTRALLLMRT